MIAKLLISPYLETRVEEFNKILTSKHIINPHPDLLYLTAEEKLGVEQAKKIREHFSLKPYSAKGRAVVLEDASKLTIDAQNALLKTLEEPPEEAILLLGAPSENDFLPTILSRCEIVILGREGVNLDHPEGVHLDRQMLQVRNDNYQADIEKLLNATPQERFLYIEKLEEKEEFLKALVSFFRTKMQQNPDLANFNQELVKAEEWAKHNVNIRAILEYLMLRMPKFQN